MTRRIPLALLSVLVLSGTPAMASDDTIPSPPPAVLKGATQHAQEGPVTFEQAKSVALKVHPGEVIESKIERGATRWVHKFKVQSEPGVVEEVWIDGSTGSVVKSSEDLTAKDTQAPPAPTLQGHPSGEKDEPVSFKQAEEMALALHPGRLIERDTKRLKTRTIYEFKIKSDRGPLMEIWIDGRNGKILRDRED